MAKKKAKTTTGAEAKAAEAKAAEAKAAEAKQGGPGRKTCPECHNSVGPRTLECKECGHKFPVSDKKAKGGAAGRGTGIPDARVVIEQMKRAHALEQALGGNWEEILTKIDEAGGVDKVRDLLQYISERKP